MSKIVKKINGYLKERTLRTRGLTTTDGPELNQHDHRFDVDENGNGLTFGTKRAPGKSGMEVFDHVHEIINWRVMPSRPGPHLHVLEKEPGVNTREGTPIPVSDEMHAEDE